jgi:hypothetical protein
MLTRISQAVSRSLFEHRPEWRRYETTDLKRSGEHHYFSVLVPPINPNAKGGLWFYHNKGFEIIVGFDVDHCHFRCQSVETPAMWMQRAIDFADDILQDKIVALSWWKGDHCSITTSAKTKSVKPDTKFTKNWQEWTSWRVRSWSGKYDRDLTRPK